MELSSSGDALQALPQKRYGALELKRIVVVVEISSFRSSRLCAQSDCGQVAIGGHGIPSTAKTSL